VSAVMNARFVNYVNRCIFAWYHMTRQQKNQLKLSENIQPFHWEQCSGFHTKQTDD